MDMENKKYKLTKNTKEWLGTTLFQIEAIASFGSVVKGELGGYIEAEKNLSVYGNAWVYGDASVYGNAWVSGDARVSGNAWVYGDASVYGNAWVSGDASVYGNAWVSGDARVSGDASVSGDARVYGKFALTLGYFFGTRFKKEEIKFHKIDDDYEVIYKGDAKIEAYEDTPQTLESTTEQEAIALLKKNGYKIIKK